MSSFFLFYCHLLFCTLPSLEFGLIHSKQFPEHVLYNIELAANCAIRIRRSASTESSLEIQLPSHKTDTLTAYENTPLFFAIDRSNNSLIIASDKITSTWHVVTGIPSQMYFYVCAILFLLLFISSSFLIDTFAVSMLILRRTFCDVRTYETV